MSAKALTNDERRELADEIGTIIAYFVANTRDARAERDYWKERAAKAEQLVTRYRYQRDVTCTMVEVQP